MPLVAAERSFPLSFTLEWNKKVMAPHCEDCAGLSLPNSPPWTSPSRDQMNPRTRTPEPPYTWQAKAALRRIRDRFESGANVASVIAAYVALTEIASDEQSGSFTKAGGYIAYRAGMARSTLEVVLPALRELGLIAYVDQPKGRDVFRVARTITLLALSESRSAQSERRPNLSDSGLIIEEQKKYTPYPLKGEECVGGNGSDDGTIPLAAKADRGEPAKATVGPVAAEAASGEAPPARTRRAREKPPPGAAPMTAVSPSFGPRIRARSASSMRSVRGPGSSRHCRRCSRRLRRGGTHAEWLKEGGRYIPHPTTWLNRGGWEDELPAVRQQPESFI